MQTNRSRFAFQRPSADLARSHLTALRYSRARIVAPEIPMPRLDSSHLSKLHREAADAVRIMAAADSCQEAKGRAVQYARFACALKQEARKLERQAEQFSRSLIPCRGLYGRANSRVSFTVKLRRLLQEALEPDSSLARGLPAAGVASRLRGAWPGFLPPFAEDPFPPSFRSEGT